MRKMAFLLSANLILWLTATTFAATWYVGTGGDFPTIQGAIGAADNGDTIVVSTGTYVENINFNGKSILLTSTDPLDPGVVANTIIDGNQSGSVVSFDGTETEMCVLSGFTITNGSGTQTGGSETTGGGGIWGGGDNPTNATIRNNVITGNTAKGSGGTSYGRGGGVLCCDGLIENNVITYNLASDGGGLCRCHGLIRQNRVSDNVVDMDGGGLERCSGIIQNNKISGNAAWSGGGMRYCDGVIQNNLIVGNVATNYGGGGLMDCNGPIVSNTIVENSAADTGGGLLVCDGVVVNCIIWGNTAPSYPQVCIYAPPRFCCIQDWAEGQWVNGPGIGNISDDPLFVNPLNDDFRLQTTSPCVNAGANYYWFAWPQRDMDGNCRLAGSSVDIGCYEYDSFPDSDGDLLCDLDEVAADTNPAIEDTDADGLRDGLEVLRGSNPLATTDPETVTIPAGDGSAIQKALSLAIPGDTIIVAPGTYQVNLVFCGVDVTLRSTDPEDPSIVASTILDGGGIGWVVAFSGYESEACTLSGLTIENGFGYRGAGIYGSLCGIGWWIDSPRIATHATIENNAITDNSAYSLGAGLYNCDGLIQSNVIRNNSSDWGGGLSSCNGAIRKNVITGNSAGSGGGAISGCSGVVEINIISENWSQSSGGGVSGSYAVIRNNLIVQNSAAVNGGGLMSCRGAITNNTIAYNSAGEKGGGLYSCNVPMTNCIIWGNTAPRNSQIYISKGGTKPTYSCVQGGVAGEGNINADPRFVGANDYHLQPNSPCIDNGINQDWMWTAFDLDGNARIFNGIVDMGAYEYMANLPPVVTITSPEDGAAFDEGETIGFVGTATDDEDGDLTASLSWTSSKDGPIGTGGSFSTILSNGVHTITASITDSQNATGSDSITITVGAPATLSVSVATNESSYKIGETVQVTVTVTDGTNPVSGAAVYAELRTGRGKIYAYNLTTGEYGTSSFSYTTNTKDGTGTYTVTATASHEGYSPGSGSTTFAVSK